MKSDTNSYLFCSCFPQKASTPLIACFCAVVCHGYPVRKPAFKAMGRGGNTFSSPLSSIPKYVLGRGKRLGGTQSKNVAVIRDFNVPKMVIILTQFLHSFP